jgi:hypothetical protein
VSLQKGVEIMDDLRLKQEIKKLDLSSKNSKEWLLAHPEDKLVSLILEQDKIRKNELRKELE